MWNAVNRDAIEVAQSVRPALIFAVKCSFFHPETIRQIRKSIGAPFVNHYPDHPYIGVRWMPREASALRRDLIEVFRQYSMVWMWERSLIERLQRDGVEARYLPFAVDPELFHPPSQLTPSPSPMTKAWIAKPATRRTMWLSSLPIQRHRCDEVAAIRRHTVAIWGSNWPLPWRTLSGQHRVHPPVWGRAVRATLWPEPPVSLNVLNAENLGGPNMRTFEIPASGGVMLARYSAEQHAFFPEGEAAAYYRSAAELDDKIELLLRRPRLAPASSPKRHPFGRRANLRRSRRARVARMRTGVSEPGEAGSTSPGQLTPRSGA